MPPMRRAILLTLILLLALVGPSILAGEVGAHHADWDGRRGVDEVSLAPGAESIHGLTTPNQELIMGISLTNGSAVAVVGTLECGENGTQVFGEWVVSSVRLVSFVVPACAAGGSRWFTLTNLDPLEPAGLTITAILYGPMPVEEGTFQFRVDPGETRGKLVFIKDQPVIATVRVLTGDWANLWVVPLTEYSINLNLSLDFSYTYWDAVQSGENTSFLILPLLDPETGAPLLQTIVIDNRHANETMTVWFSVLPADDAVRQGAVRSAVIASLLPVALVALAGFFYVRDRGAAAEAERATVPTQRHDPPTGAPVATDADSDSR